MADDFLGSVAQEDVQFVTEIVKTVNPGDNYKHLIAYADDSQFVTGASLANVKDPDGNVVAKFAEVTADGFKDVVKGELLVWLTDYFNAGGNESVYVVNFTMGETGTKALLTAAFNVTHQWGWFKTICVADADVSAMFHLDPDAASWLAELCATDKLLSSAPLYPISTPVAEGEVTDTAYVAVETAGFDAFWVYHLPVLQADNTTYVVHNGAMVALGLALNVINGSGVYAGNSFDMVATTVISASGVDGGALSATVQAVLKGKNINYFKFVGDTTGAVDLRGGKTSKGDLMSAMWIVNYCNFYNKVMVANYMSRRNVYKSAVTYNVILAILIKTVSRFVTSGRLKDFGITAPAYADLPPAEADEIVVPNAWEATYQDDLRTVKVYGTLYI
jgi:hypothetical protein